MLIRGSYRPSSLSSLRVWLGGARACGGQVVEGVSPRPGPDVSILTRIQSLDTYSHPLITVLNITLSREESAITFVF